MDNFEKGLAGRLKALISEKAPVREVRVFGSRARGDAAPDSDMDVLVVLETLDHEIERYVSQCAWEVGFPADVVIVPVTVSYSAITDSPLKESVFIKNVLREGLAV